MNVFPRSFAPDIVACARQIIDAAARPVMIEAVEDENASETEDLD